ncbi:MAG: hypothetical protein A2V77_23040 [Anaeromyxobacter sp. RBG_16_69_14]|nr:MAG: hypothetical protein A2V77_23040 [Anaeromyxobacter sp. RBG_16_69_14]
MSDEDVEGLDEEFLYHLNRGADFLAKGELESARSALARTRALRPKDPKALGLLGQSLYKLGRLDEAIGVYERLVDETPVEAAARVNLGLAYLKGKRHAQAVRQLEIALDLNPDHKKAMGYLGVAWLEQGKFVDAREWFQRAGSEQMVAKCNDLLALAEAEAVPSDPSSTPEPGPVASPAAPQASEGPGVPARVVAESGGHGLVAFTASRLVPPVGDGTFALVRGLLTVAIRRDVLVREGGLLAVRGAVRLVPEMKRFRGHAIDKPFGEGSCRMLRASGEGALLYRVPGVCLAPVDLAGESGYFREDVVFAFEDAVVFENGRVASQPGRDLNLVHLRGPGRVLLATRGEIAALEVTREAPLRVPVAGLVGWTGTVTPKIGPMVVEGVGEAADGAPGEQAVVELGGDGRVLLDEGAAA